MNGTIKLGTTVTPDLSSEAQRGLVTAIRGDSGAADVLSWVQKDSTDTLVLKSINSDGLGFAAVQRLIAIGAPL